MPARILIIEDEALVALELRFLLEDLGHEVVGLACDGDQAERLIRANRADLALVDIHLSDGPTGVDLGRRLAHDHRVSVLFMTANPGMVRDGVEGAIGVLSKPADEFSIKKSVDYALAWRMGAPPPPAPPELQLFG